MKQRMLQLRRRTVRLGIVVEGVAIIAAIAAAFWIGVGWSPIEVTVSMMITAVIVVFMLYLFGKALKKDNRTAWASYLVSLGIFGTFLGITVALLSLGTGAVEESVPDLLGGMQIAFISSAVGILLSLILRWKDVSTTVRGSGREKTAADIHDVLKRQTRVLESLERAMVGDGDATLITQLKLLRQDLAEITEAAKRTSDDAALGIEGVLEGLDVDVEETEDRLSQKNQA
jgi:MFS family permease